MSERAGKASTVGIFAGTPVGLALAGRLRADGREVALARTTGELAVLRSHRAIVVDVTPLAAREVAHALGDVLDGGHLVAHTVRGLCPDGKRMTEVLHEETAVRRLGVLAGPLEASELEAGRPSAAVIASRHPEVVHELSAALSTPSFRVYRAHDPLGVELASAVTDLIAVGVGAAHALDLHETAVALLLVRAIRELGRLIAGMGGDAATANGLAGLGDVLVRARSTESPMFQLGAKLARGDASAREQLKPAATALKQLASRGRPNGSAHVFAGLLALLDGTVDAHALVTRLMTLPVLDE